MKAVQGKQGNNLLFQEKLLVTKTSKKYGQKYSQLRVVVA
jgi:hypothetical protein